MTGRLIICPAEEGGCPTTVCVFWATLGVIPGAPGFTSTVTATGPSIREGLGIKEAAADAASTLFSDATWFTAATRLASGVRFDSSGLIICACLFLMPCITASLAPFVCGVVDRFLIPNRSRRLRCLSRFPFRITSSCSLVMVSFRFRRHSRYLALSASICSLLIRSFCFLFNSRCFSRLAVTSSGKSCIFFFSRSLTTRFVATSSGDLSVCLFVDSRRRLLLPSALLSGVSASSSVPFS